MECSLTKGELIRLDGGKGGLMMHCTAGTIWLTIGDGNDHLIKAGIGFRIPAGYLAVAEALECTELRLEGAVSLDPILHKPLTGFVAC